ncbi:MAG TPA: PD-(D/E)XK nuclease family protein [Candidatus Paceibacterota bacterium]|nr:PD-(D/E)XK nuclease family protein [Candidatus Paceibacterota bacterium]
MAEKFSSIRISRSGLKLFQECPRCFWLDVHHKIRRPPGYPYTLSAAVDFLVKQEFDKYRINGELPPVFKRHNIKAKLYAGPELATWRENFKGVQYYDEDLNAMLYGAVDDVLQFEDGSLAVVDYKSSGSREIRIYDDYQKQMEVYTHLLARNGFKTQPEAYFVFYQVDKTGGGFQNALPFNESLKAVKLNTKWVPEVFEQAVMVARRDTPPDLETPCEHCIYVQKSSSFFDMPAARGKKKKTEPVLIPFEE